MRINFMRRGPLPVFLVRSWHMKFYIKIKIYCVIYIL